MNSGRLNPGGVSVKELAEYLGHADPGFTLRVYAHLLPSSHDRARIVIDDHFRSFGRNSHGTAASHDS
jgi:integrase